MERDKSRGWFDSVASSSSAVVLIGLIGVLDAWAAILLWTWFVVPLGVTPISFAHAFGLLCLCSVVTLRIKESDYVPTASDLAFRIASPLILALAGYLFSRWVV